MPAALAYEEADSGAAWTDALFPSGTGSSDLDRQFCGVEKAELCLPADLATQQAGDAASLPFDFCAAIEWEDMDIPCMADELELEVKRLDSMTDPLVNLFEAVADDGDGALASCCFDLGGRTASEAGAMACSEDASHMQWAAESEERLVAGANPSVAAKRTVSKRAAAQRCSGGPTSKGRLSSRPPVQPGLVQDNAAHLARTGAPLRPGAWRGCHKSALCDRENRHRGICNHKASVPGPAALTEMGTASVPTLRRVGSGGVRTAKRARFGAGLLAPLPYIKEEESGAEGLEGEEEGEEEEEEEQRHSAQVIPDSECVDGSDSESEGEHGHQPVLAAKPCSSTAAAGHSDADDDAHTTHGPEGLCCAPEPRAWGSAAPCMELSNCSGGGGAQSDRSDTSCQSPRSAGAPPPMVLSVDVGTCSDSDTHGCHHGLAAGGMEEAGGEPPLGVTTPCMPPRVIPAPSPEPTAAAVAPERQPLLNDPAGHGTSAAALAPDSPVAPGRSVAAMPRGAVTGKRKVAGMGRSDAGKTRKKLSSNPADFLLALVPGMALVGGTYCTACGKQETPVWRQGPKGPKTLCNACGVRYMKVKKPGR